jgi:hypothetical protein
MEHMRVWCYTIGLDRTATTFRIEQATLDTSSNPASAVVHDKRDSD